MHSGSILEPEPHPKLDHEEMEYRGGRWTRERNPPRGSCLRTAIPRASPFGRHSRSARIDTSRLGKHDLMLHDNR